MTRTPSDVNDRGLAVTMTEQADPGHELCYINKACKEFICFKFLNATFISLHF